MKANRNKISAMIWIKSPRSQMTSKIKRFADFVAEIWSLQNLSLLKVIPTSCSIHIVRLHVLIQTKIGPISTVVGHKFNHLAAKFNHF